MDTLKKKNPLACDDEIKFDPDQHAYTIDGTRCISVTGLISSKLEKPAPWNAMKTKIVSTIEKRTEFWRKTFSLIQEHARADAMKTIKHSSFTDVLWPMRYEKYYSQQIWRKWECHIQNETVPHETEIHLYPPPFSTPSVDFVSKTWDKTSDDGKALHADIERFLNYVELGDFSGLPAEPHTPEFRNFLRFYYANPHYEYIRTELVLGMSEIGLCGTADAVLRDTETGEFIIVDWKNTLSITSENPEDDDDAKKTEMFLPPFDVLKATKRNKYMIQLNLYAFLLQSMGYEVPHLLLVQCYHQLSNPVVVRFPNITNTPRFRKFIDNQRKEFASKQLRIKD